MAESELDHCRQHVNIIGGPAGSRHRTVPVQVPNKHFKVVLQWISCVERSNAFPMDEAETHLAQVFDV